MTERDIMTLDELAADYGIDRIQAVETLSVMKQIGENEVEARRLLTAKFGEPARE